MLVLSHFNNIFFNTSKYASENYTLIKNLTEKYFWKQVLLYSGQKGKVHNVNSEKQ